ncbi:MAG: transposase [Sphingopyxis sp.]|nr:transposase [Sphingopyxis sp.]
MADTMVRTARYRLCPSAVQAETMAQFAGVCRLVYNIALEQRRDWYRQFKIATGKNISFYSQAKELKDLRASVDWIGAAPHCAQVQALWDLDDAFQRFFRGKNGYPSPRRKGENDSFRIPGKEFHSPIRNLPNTRYAEVRLPKLGWCKFRLSRPLPIDRKLIEATVVLDALGWHICLVFRVSSVATAKLDGHIGIDRGVANTLSLSDGTFASQPVARLDALARRSKTHQKRLSRQKRGSNRSAMTRRMLAKTRAKIARVRKHWNHEQSTRIAAGFGTVVMEALKTGTMTRSAKGTIEAPGVNVRQKAGLNRSILEHGWHQFERLLAYKLDAAGGRLIRVDPAYTSQTCSACGSIAKTHRKSQAVFECSDCGHAAHADTNAALNILRAGEQPASRGAVRPSVKREPSEERPQ